MTRLRAIVMAAILFGGVCLTLGGLGAMLIETGRVLTVYAAAVLGFAAWAARETYRDCQVEPGNQKL